MKHRISAGVLAMRGDEILLVRHFRPGKHDFWAGPGGGVEGSEELAEAAEREAFEETRLRVATSSLAYIDELVDGWGRVVKFWFLAEYVSGEIDVTRNPASGEAISEAGWFGQNTLPKGHVFPEILRDRFWEDRHTGFPAPIKLPLRTSIF
ncbi:MAG: NUDIX domain-containing protein [Devosia sp.]|jgi:8-oxo-dGTP diphosphatase|uniref:NUDIX domain-containing protein n=1 Tax=unclassified Devosia TaxID=196773 RepID=UPI0019F4ACBD|nr:MULTISPECIES: NUDIX domain-containing protein [unclassified Devosia]MBF0680579.1 NUDIX domain-containing protein [Devosia sp.]WEJ33377.1 NUDIX domain-containing protein [Devosia sp. SD17-2]